MKLNKDAQRLRTDAAMLESLAGTFRILADGGPFVCSFNFQDVADLLTRASYAVKPGPALVAGRAALQEGKE